MSTPNLDATGHWWVGALAQCNLELEYQKGHGNMMADLLSQVTTWLDLETVKSILDGVTLGMVHHAKVHDLAMVEGNQCLEQKVCVTPGHPLVEMLVTDWAKAQRGGPDVEHSVGLAEGMEADKSKDTSGRTCLQWRR